MVSSIHNDVEMSLWLQPREDTLRQKICKTDLEEDAKTFAGELFNRPLGESQHGLDEQADKENGKEDVKIRCYCPYWSERIEWDAR